VIIEPRKKMRILWVRADFISKRQEKQRKTSVLIAGY
jgi:hypothetical protein